MRIYENSYELISEMFRDLNEMGRLRSPHSMQNKEVKGDFNYQTKELEHYVYRLLSLGDTRPLFFLDPKAEKWALSEFSERVTSHYQNPGEAWLLRKEVWEQFLNENGMFDYTYQGRIDPAFNLKLIAEELKSNPDSRQAWLPIFQPKDLRYMGGKRRIPCSLGYFFRITQDGDLSLTYIQRSADAVTHFGNDVFLAWLMLEYVASLIGVKPESLTHHIFSLHSYQKDWPILEKGISELGGLNG